MSEANPSGGGAQGQPALALLVVDDEVHVAGELADAAIDEGYIVHVANSAASALEAIARYPEISVMVSDIRMPDVDGIELTRQVLAMRAEVHAVEVILITGHATLNDAITAVRTGAFDFVRKPFRLREILEAVSRARARSIGRRRIAETQRLPVIPPAHNARLGEGSRGWLAETILNDLMYELRTPLVPVLGFAELLESSADSFETRDYARQIGAGARLMLTTVEDLVTLARLDSGLTRLACLDVETDGLLRNAVEAHSAAACLQGVSLAVTEAQGRLHADPMLLRRALDVLLRVAVQHAARGGAVALWATRSGTDPAVSIHLEAVAAAQYHDDAVLDGISAAMQVAPLGTRLAHAVARLHEGSLVIPPSPGARFRAKLTLPVNGPPRSA